MFKFNIFSLKNLKYHCTSCIDKMSLKIKCREWKNVQELPFSFLQKIDFGCTDKIS